MLCERIRAQVSVELDGELSELERRMLEAHLVRCPDCRTYAADVAAFTHELRMAPLEDLEHPIVIRRPRRVTRARAQVGLAAAAAVVVLGFALQLGVPGADESAASSARTPTRFDTTSQTLREMRQIIADGRAFDRHKQRSAIPM
jgi:predicted anti-sigma-YlaC factor YlaD